MTILAYPHYIAAAMLLAVGLYTTIASEHLVKKLLGLGVFQTAILLFFISTGWVEGGTPPIMTGTESVHVNPLPQVLMLTAIVVGVATLAVGLALIKKN